jgi:hypothetical protein
VSSSISLSSLFLNLLSSGSNWWAVVLRSSLLLLNSSFLRAS